MSGTLAVVSQSGSSISFFDLASGERTAHMTDLISEPHELVLDSKRKGIMYCSHAYHHGHFWAHGDNGHQISIIDSANKKVIDVIDTKPALGPHGLVLDAERDILWCSYEELEGDEEGNAAGSGGGIIAIDLSSPQHAIIKRVPSSAKTHWFVITPDGKKAFTCNKTSPFISVLNLEKEVMAGKIDAPGGTEECSVSPDGKFAYFPTPGMQFGKVPEKAEILVVDTATDEVVDRILLDAGSSALSTHVVAANGRIMVGEYLYQSTGTAGKPTPGRLSVYDPATREFTGDPAEIGGLPLTLRTSPDGKLGFTANILVGSVSVVDMETMTTIKTLPVDNEKSKLSNLCQGAHGMAYFE